LRRAIAAMMEIQRDNRRNHFIAPLLPPIYKGVSFNPETFQRGQRSEWLVILDFFSLLRQSVAVQSQTELPSQAAILDAGLYWVVNLLGRDGIRLTESKPDAAANQMINLLIGSCAQENLQKVIQTNQVRNAYLRVIASQFPANNTPPVFSLMDVWQDPEFSGFLTKAIELFCVYSQGNWQVQHAVHYERYMTYSPWVTPLVAAEQALLCSKSGFRANLAPTTEAAWNHILDKMCGRLGLKKYIIWMYVRRLGARLPYGAMPCFADDQQTIAVKLGRSSVDDNLGGLIIGLIRPFMGDHWFNEVQSCLKSKDNLAVAKMIYAFTSSIEESVTQLLAQDQLVPQLRLDNMGWLMRFPQGAC